MPASPSPPEFPPAAAEAARYALLRRLAPSMRHHLVVNLQPIGMICEVMERRLRAPAPDLAHVQDSAAKINGFTRSALDASVNVIGWLAPDDAATTTVEEAVRECAALLTTSLSFRGYALRNEVAPLGGAVRRAGIRNLLCATLLHCSDHTAAPADLELAATGTDAGARISVRARGTPGERSFAGEANYRPLSWADLQALAAADGVGLAREGDRVELSLPWATPPQAG